MEQITSTLSVLPNTKTEIQSFATIAKQQLLSGCIDFKRILFQKACIERSFDAIFSDPEVKEFIESEISKYGKDGVGFEDAKFQISSRKSYTYDQTNDSEIKALESAKKEVETGLKERQKFLQTLKHSIDVVNKETGEVETIFPAAFTETTYIKTTLK